MLATGGAACPALPPAPPRSLATLSLHCTGLGDAGLAHLHGLEDCTALRNLDLTLDGCSLSHAPGVPVRRRGPPEGIGVTVAVTR